MISVSVITLFTFVTVAPAELKVLPFRRADLDNMTLGVLTSHLTKGVLMSPMSLRMPQGRPDLSSQWMRTWRPLASPNIMGAQMTSARAAAGAPRVIAAAAATNVFGEQLQGCVAEGDMCAYDEKNPKVCVRTGKTTMRFYCKSIWEADWKPFRKTGGQEMESQKPAMGDTTKCEAISSEALDSQYSKDVYSNLWASVPVSRVNPIMSKTMTEQVPKKSSKARRFRKSIDFICRTCALYAENENAKSTLDSKCKAMGWSVNALDDPPPLTFSKGTGAVDAEDAAKVETGAAPTSYGWGKKWTGEKKETAVGQGPWTLEKDAEGKWAEKFPKKGDWNSLFKEDASQTKQKQESKMAALYFPLNGFVGGVFVGSGVAFMLFMRFRKRTLTIDGSAFQHLTA